MAGHFRTFIFALAGLAALTGPAWANWQFTAWDMCPSDVKEASRGNAVRLSDEESRRHSALDGTEIAKLKMPYTQGGAVFNVYFLFSHDDDKLSGVTLDLVSGDPEEANRMLREYYGRPVSDRNEAGRTQVWFSGSDRIVAKQFGGAISVQYNPRMDVYDYGL